MTINHPVRLNNQVRLAARPTGLATHDDFTFTEEPVPAAAAGEFVVDVSHISIDPAMRGWMNAGASYIPPVAIGDVMRAGAIGTVSTTEHPDFAVGDHVYGTFGAQEHAVSDGKGVIKIDTTVAPATTYLGALGITGLTAYFGLLDVAKIKAGDTVRLPGTACSAGSVSRLLGKLSG